MNTLLKSRLVWLLLGLVLVLCVAGTKLSLVTRTTYLETNSLIYVVTNAGFPNGSRAITAGDLGSNLFRIYPPSGIVAVGATNVTTTNSTMFGVFSEKSGSTLGFFGLQQGTNTILYRNGSNIVINSQPSGGAAAAFSEENVLFVRTNGNDGTAIRGRPDKPYLTPGAAKAASIAGDLIHVGPGLYSSLVTNLLKHNVNWHFQAGAVLSNWNAGTIPMCIWDNTGWGTPGTVVSTITGDGVFIQRGGWDESGIIGLISTVDSGTRLSIECQKILASSDSSTFYILAQHEGQIRLIVKDGIDTAYGPTETSGVSLTGGWWWGNAAYAWGSVSTPKLLTSGSSAFYSIASGPGDFFANVEYAYSTNAPSVWLEPSHKESKFWLTFKDLKGGSNMISRGSVLTMAGGKFYGTGQKISSFYEQGLPLIGMTNGIAWIEIQKAEVTNKTFFVEHHAPGGTLNLRCVDYFDLGSGSGQRSYNFNIAGGTNNFFGGQCITTWGPGVKISDGEASFVNFKMNTSRTIATSNHTFWVSGGNLVLDNCTAIPGGSNSVFASMARNIRVYGTLSTRSNIAPAITLLSGDLLVNESIDR